MQIVTDKEKCFELILSKSGNGKTVVEYLLIKSKQMPSLIVDSYDQFKGVHKSLKQVIAYFLDYENLEDFRAFNRQILIKLKPNEASDFYEYLLKSKFLNGCLIVNDEIDMTLGTANIPNNHSFYQFCNRGRHQEFHFIATARATQNIPKVLAQQTDVYYIGKVQNKPMLDYLTNNTNIKELEQITDTLKDYEYIKYNTSSEVIQKFTYDIKLLNDFK